MASADGKLFELFEDEVRRALLRCLLDADEALTQKQLTAALRLNSATISRRMGELESAGLVEREGPRAPYELVFPGKTRDLIQLAKDLARDAAGRIAAQAADDADDFRKAGMAGGILRDRAREGS